MATNTHRTLNDYRLTPEPLDSGPQSKRHVGAGAIVFAIFLAVGAYFFYSTQQRNENTSVPAGETTLPESAGATEQSIPAPRSNSTDSMTESVPGPAAP